MSRFKEFADPAVRISVLVGATAVYGVLLAFVCHYMDSGWPAVGGSVLALVAILTYFELDSRKLENKIFKDGP